MPEFDPIRQAPREDSLRIVEYTRFPRGVLREAAGIGFTRDLSEAGMCLGVDNAEPIGSLLRVTLRGTDGRIEPPAVHRVVWCSAEQDGRHWLGLELLSDASAAAS